jgi:hypothetical protein
MFKNLQPKYFDLAQKIGESLPDNKHSEVDFSLPWYKCYFMQGFWSLGIVFLSSIIGWTFIALTPFFFTYSFVNLRFDWLLYIFLARLGILAFSRFYARKMELDYTTNLQNSVYLSAIKKLISVDPIYHTFRETGVIISKISRIQKSLSNITNIIINEIMITFTGAVVSIITLASVNLKYGLASAAFISIIIIANILVNIFDSQAIDGEVLKYEDNVRQKEISLITQIGYIRSIFATQMGFSLLHKSRIDYTNINWGGRYVGSILYSLIVMLYYLGLFVISYLLLQEVQNQTLQTAVALGLITTYLYNTGSLFNIGGVAKSLTQDIIYLDDFFKFVNKYGQQTFPVLDKPKQD